jgi:hypothetical protein
LSKVKVPSPSRPSTWRIRSPIASGAIRRGDADQKMKLTNPLSKPTAKTIRNPFHRRHFRTPHAANF